MPKKRWNLQLVAPTLLRRYLPSNKQKAAQLNAGRLC